MGSKSDCCCVLAVTSLPLCHTHSLKSVSLPIFTAFSFSCLHLMCTHMYSLAYKDTPRIHQTTEELNDNDLEAKSRCPPRRHALWRTSLYRECER